MKCPVCSNIALVRTPYEGVAVSICPACHGFLLAASAMKSIERNPEMSQEVLEEEIQIMADTVKAVKCPKCRIDMEKKCAPHSLAFNIDVCISCKMIWLDAGELESIQIAYETSSVGQENMQRRKTMENMSTERKMQLQDGIDKAPDRMSMVDFEQDLCGNNYGSNRYSFLVNCLISSLFRL